jgi:hypothetical protein
MDQDILGDIGCFTKRCPEALLGALRDFVERREKFVVNSASTAINP